MLLFGRGFQPRILRVLACCLVQISLAHVPVASAQFGGGGFEGDGGSSEGGMCAPECWCAGVECPVMPAEMCGGCNQGPSHEESPISPLGTGGKQRDNEVVTGGGGSLSCINANPCNLAYSQALLVCLGETDIIPGLPAGTPIPPGIGNPLDLLRRGLTPGGQQTIGAISCLACAEAMDEFFSLICTDPLTEGPWENNGGLPELCLENSVSSGNNTYVSWLWDSVLSQAQCLDLP